MGIFDKWVTPDPNNRWDVTDIKGKKGEFVIKDKATKSQIRYNLKKKGFIGLGGSISGTKHKTDYSKPAGPKKAGKKTTKLYEYNG